MDEKEDSKTEVRAEGKKKRKKKKKKACKARFGTNVASLDLPHSDGQLSVSLGSGRHSV
jgi:hypothetical protein